MVGIDEALDPGHHGGSAQSVASCTAGVVFDIEHSWERAAVA